MNEFVWRNVGILLRGENRSTRDKPVPVPFCPQQILAGLKPGSRSKRIATNSRSNCTTPENMVTCWTKSAPEERIWIYRVGNLLETKIIYMEIQRDKTRPCAGEINFLWLTTGYNVNDQNRNCKFRLEIQNEIHETVQRTKTAGCQHKSWNIQSDDMNMNCGRLGKTNAEDEKGRP